VIEAKFAACFIRSALIALQQSCFTLSSLTKCLISMYACKSVRETTCYKVLVLTNVFGLSFNVIISNVR